MELQDDNWCFACGSLNASGLRLSGFRKDGDDLACEFTPERHHQSWSGITHGGVLSTLLDEVMLHVVRAQGNEAVTAEMTVRFRSPVPTGTVLEVRARVVSQRRKLVLTEGEIRLPDGRVAVRASASFIRPD